MTLIGNTGIGGAHGGDIFNESAAPEPASFILLGTGLLAIGGLRYRRRVSIR